MFKRNSSSNKKLISKKVYAIAFAFPFISLFAETKASKLISGANLMLAENKQAEMFKFTHKLGLGTAQWGLDYGISNTSGQSSQAEVTKILELATSVGIKIIDTASSYGNSEKIIGKNK